MKFASSVLLCAATIFALSSDVAVATEKTRQRKAKEVNNLKSVNGEERTILKDDEAYWSRILEDEGSFSIEPTAAPTPGPTPAPTPRPTPGPSPGPTPRPTPSPTPQPSPGPTGVACQVDVSCEQRRRWLPLLQFDHCELTKPAYCIFRSASRALIAAGLTAPSFQLQMANVLLPMEVLI